MGSCSEHFAKSGLACDATARGRSKQTGHGAGVFRCKGQRGIIAQLSAVRMCLMDCHDRRHSDESNYRSAAPGVKACCPLQQAVSPEPRSLAAAHPCVLDTSMICTKRTHHIQACVIADMDAVPAT